nr:alpha/beta fold hydrolase [Mediterraneibacter gnavus]
MLLREGEGEGEEIFLIHAGSGEVGVYVELCKHIDKKYKCWAFHALDRKEISPENIEMETLAAIYIKNLKKVKPHGPYNLIGWCVGGTIAYEIAAQLEKQGEVVKHLTLINSNAPSAESRERIVRFDTLSETALVERFAGQYREKVENKDIAEIWETVLLDVQQGLIERDKLKVLIPGTILRVIPNKDSGNDRSFIKYVNRIRSYVNARDYYIPSSQLMTPVTYISAKDEKIENRTDWQRYVSAEIDFCEVNGTHVSIFEADNAYELAIKINEQL